MARTLDQMLANEKPEVVAKAQKAAAEMLLNIHLAELRERMNLTQGDIAASLGIKQPTVSDMESKGVGSLFDSCFFFNRAATN